MTRKRGPTPKKRWRWMAACENCGAHNEVFTQLRGGDAVAPCACGHLYGRYVRTAD